MFQSPKNSELLVKARTEGAISGEALNSIFFVHFSVFWSWTTCFYMSCTWDPSCLSELVLRCRLSFVRLKELRRTAAKRSPVDASHSVEAWREKKKVIGRVGAESAVKTNNEKITAASEAAKKNVLKVNVQRSHAVCGSCLSKGTSDHFLRFHFLLNWKYPQPEVYIYPE